jgi:3-deoxy-7-phosphoheptulonate synthase
MGADAAARHLPALVREVRDAGHPVVWLCDPMHGNTIAAPHGGKTRLVDAMAREIRGFRQAMATCGGIGGGLHLETTPHDVIECVADAASMARVPARTESLCDPRLTQAQALSLIAVWAEAPEG